jgi:hypothetical protein
LRQHFGQFAVLIRTMRGPVMDFISACSITVRCLVIGCRLVIDCRPVFSFSVAFFCFTLGCFVTSRRRVTGRRATDGRVLDCCRVTGTRVTGRRATDCCRVTGGRVTDGRVTDRCRVTGRRVTDRRVTGCCRFIVCLRLSTFIIILFCFLTLVSVPRLVPWDWSLSFFLALALFCFWRRIVLRAQKFQVQAFKIHWPISCTFFGLVLFFPLAATCLALGSTSPCFANANRVPRRVTLGTLACSSQVARAAALLSRYSKWLPLCTNLCHVFIFAIRRLLNGTSLFFSLTATLDRFYFALMQVVCSITIISHCLLVDKNGARVHVLVACYFYFLDVFKQNSTALLTHNCYKANLLHFRGTCLHDLSILFRFPDQS